MGGYVYVLTNANRTTLYIGVTGNLACRIFEHVHQPAPGSFVERYRLRHLVYAEAHPTILDVIAREKQLKRWSRAKKHALIGNANFHWRDLAEWSEGYELPEIELPSGMHKPLVIPPRPS